ncbi:MAG: hypothetical protein IJP32_09910 [Clostridia bacterium]|nr:hypothetical protein [Clostridia bacterium]MBQ9996675.1 hypothetical protein [Clostridia bacterium]
MKTLTGGTGYPASPVFLFLFHRRAGHVGFADLRAGFFGELRAAAGAETVLLLSDVRELRAAEDADARMSGKNLRQSGITFRERCPGRRFGAVTPAVLTVPGLPGFQYVPSYSLTQTGSPRHTCFFLRIAEL